MKRFEFRLERLLRVRQQTEKVKRQRLAAIRRDVEREQAILERLKGSRDNVLNELRAYSLQGVLDIPCVVDCYYRLQLIDDCIKAQKAVIDNLKRKEALERQAVIAARRDRKAVENLRDRAYAKHLHEQARIEQRFLDEVGLVQYMKEGGDKTNERSILG